MPWHSISPGVFAFVNVLWHSTSLGVLAFVNMLWHSPNRGVFAFVSMLWHSPNFSVLNFLTASWHSLSPSVLAFFFFFSLLFVVVAFFTVLWPSPSHGVHAASVRRSSPAPKRWHPDPDPGRSGRRRSGYGPVWSLRSGTSAKPALLDTSCRRAATYDPSGRIGLHLLCVRSCI